MLVPQDRSHCVDEAAPLLPKIQRSVVRDDVVGERQKYIAALFGREPLEKRLGASSALDMLETENRYQVTPSVLSIYRLCARVPSK